MQPSRSANFQLISQCNWKNLPSGYLLDCNHFGVTRPRIWLSSFQRGSPFLFWSILGLEVEPVCYTFGRITTRTLTSRNNSSIDWLFWILFIYAAEYRSCKSGEMCYKLLFPAYATRWEWWNQNKPKQNLQTERRNPWDGKFEMSLHYVSCRLDLSQAVSMPQNEL